jgi:hypothetical protein
MSTLQKSTQNNCRSVHQPAMDVNQKTDINDLLPPPMLFISKSTPTDHKTGLLRNHLFTPVFSA